MIIARSTEDATTVEDADESFVPSHIVLARYGQVPQVARFGTDVAGLQRGERVVCRTERGDELADVLQVEALPEPGGTFAARVLRRATQDDLALAQDKLRFSESRYAAWLRRVADWKLQLELIDLECTLDDRVILYVLNDRNAETTRMALLAAANGLGIVHVQPVSSEGIVSGDAGGCGSCGCGH